MNKANKQLWGVRLFDEAITAEGRRGFRTSRKRYDRRRKRIKLLQNEFRDEINKVDPNFFKKLKESFYNESDTKNKTIILSKEEKKQIKEYNKKYKTIYHLRERLINNPEKEDIRLVYLAIHHIIKYRGNFLYNSDSFNVDNLNISEKLNEIFNNIYSLCDELELNIDILNDNFYQVLENALIEKSNTDKKVLIKASLNDNIYKDFTNEFIKLILGNKFSISKLFNIELDEDINISFKSSEYDDNCSKLEKSLGDKIEVLNNLKELYNILFLKSLFKNSNNTNISSLMVKRYNEHANDLKFLKQLLKYDDKLYKIFFKDNLSDKKDEFCIYRKYVNNALSYEEFKKELNKALEIIFNYNIDENLIDEYTSYFKERIDENLFLPRITDSDNGKYPYQLNKVELEKIIENQGKYYPFLKQTVKDSNKEVYKLVKLLTFKIPYYIGPLNNTTNKKGIVNKNAWAVKKDNKIQVTPYNFDEIIDKEASAELFITRMISHCTYLLNEYALPSNSILYCKYKVMNELKQIKVMNRKIPNSLQHTIFDELFLKTNSFITERKFINYLKGTNEYNMYDNLNIEGYSSDKKFANNMQSYVDFFGEDGIFKDTDYKINDAEEIIRWITIFEDKDILETKVRKEYPKLNDRAVKLILSKRYTGWGNLSEKLLNGIYYKDKESNINKSIMDLMYETEDNFMQIIFKKEYGFQDKIDEINLSNVNNKLDYSIVDALATSPSTKRAIYQSLKIVKEITDYMGYDPENIMIEMSRGEDKVKSRKDTKKTYLNKLYDKFKKDINDYNKLKKELNSFDKIDSQKLFLYFIQEGKSLYSRKPLNIDNLEEYEIDHIIPRTLIKDDSIENKALVLRSENHEKAANFVLPSNFRTRDMINWWIHLKDCNLITSKKFNNLCRNYYTEKDIEGFINRQLVETRQITKHVASILNNFYKDTKIVYLNAELSSNYRKKFELFKYRDLNDYHHAHDAYLAAVIGEYKEKYLNTTTDFEKLKEITKKLIEEKKYNELSYGYVINSISNDVSLFDEDTGEIKFDADLFNETVKETLYRNDILISKKTEIKTGEFYNQTKSKKGNKGVPLKENLPTELYGSYTSLNPSYSVLVKYTKKNKTEQRLIGVPIYYSIKNNNDNNILINYIASLLQIDDKNSIEIIKDKIPFYTILDWDGQICSLVGATDKVEVCNAKEFKINKENQIKWKYTLNRLFNKNINSIDDVIYNNQLNEVANYIIEKIETDYKLYENLLPEIKEFLSDDVLNNITIDTKEKTLLELFKLLKFNSATANLKCLDSNLSLAFGKKHSRIISHFTIINKSVTGLREHRNEF